MWWRRLGPYSDRRPSLELQPSGVCPGVRACTLMSLRVQSDPASLSRNAAAPVIDGTIARFSSSSYTCTTVRNHANVLVQRGNVHLRVRLAEPGAHTVLHGPVQHNTAQARSAALACDLRPFRSHPADAVCSERASPFRRLRSVSTRSDESLAARSTMHRLHAHSKAQWSSSSARSPSGSEVST
jgi:hypothetical protein